MSSSNYKTCKTCGERGVPVPIEGGVVHTYSCTAEVVVLHSGKERVIKRCPDMMRVGRERVILTRSEEK